MPADNPAMQSLLQLPPRRRRAENSRLFLADAVARLSHGKKIGVFACQHGPGVENAFGSVAQAYSESIPLLVLPGGYATRSIVYARRCWRWSATR